MRSQQEMNASEGSRAIIEMVTTIRVYKFAQLSRREVETMLGLSLEETRVYQEAKAEGRQEGERSLILRLLTRQFGDLPDSVRSPMTTLSLSQLEALGEALLDFTKPSDLAAWLQELE